MNKTKYLTGLLTALLISAAAAVTPTPTRSPSPTASPSATPTPSPIPVSPNFTVSWDANPASDSVTKYIVSYGPAARSGASFAYPSNVDVTSGTTLAIEGRPVGKLYISLRAVNATGTSAYSNELVLDVKAGAPAAPTNLRITVTGLTLNLKPGKYSVTMSGKRRKGSIGTIEIVPQR